MEQALLPSFVGPQYLRVRVWSGPVDCQWCSLVFLSLPSLRRKYNWEISRALSSSSKSFAYILCSHTNHQLSGLAVFVLEDSMAVAVSHLIPAVSVKESRNFCFGIRATLIYLLYKSLSEIVWLKLHAREKWQHAQRQNNLVEVDTLNYNASSNMQLSRFC